MTATANLTNMPVLACRFQMTTLVVVPQTAWVSFSPTQIRTVFLLRFLLGRNAAFTSAMPLEMVGFEVMEFADFVEGYIIDRSNMLPDSFIKVKCMLRWIDMKYDDTLAVAISMKIIK
jgi:hypothetical protein